MAESLEAEVEGLERFIAALDTETWNGVIRYLSGVLIEKEHARSSIPVEETIKHAMCQGQINQIILLTNELENAKKLVQEKADALSDVRNRMDNNKKGV